MENQEKISILNDLVQINNDRIEGYNKASDELKDSDSEMKAIFQNMVEESVGYKNDLIEKVNSLGGDAAKDSTISGKVYRVWMDLKATFTGNDPKSIVAACEFGEDAAQAAYAKALEEADTETDIRYLINEQKSSLHASHNLIKHYREKLSAD